MSDQSQNEDDNGTMQLPEVSAETIALINAVLLANDRRNDTTFSRLIASLYGPHHSQTVPHL